jgi:hypothetical protein
MTTTYGLPNNRRLDIVQDVNPESPRTWDNLSKLILFGKYKHLSDKHEIDANDYNGWENNKKAVIKAFNPAMIVPLYMFSHSGETVSLNPFSCPWDSGQLGWVIVTKEDANKEYSVKRITKKVLEKITSVIEAEVKVFDQYITGDVYGYVIRDENDDEEDSCWGFFGSDIKENGILDNINELDKKEVLTQI